jgi:lipopolysaccharide export system protein LptA
MKMLCLLFLLASCGLLRAQTNAPAKAPAEQTIAIDSVHWYVDGISNQMVWYENVYVTDNQKTKLHCERLTVDVPQNDDPLTNIVAETNVVIDMVKDGHTNHITANRAVYAFSLSTNLVGIITTNQTVTFTGGDPRPVVESPDGSITGDTLVYNVLTQTFGGDNVRSKFKIKAGKDNGTNGSPFNFSK